MLPINLIEINLSADVFAMASLARKCKEFLGRRNI